MSKDEELKDACGNCEFYFESDPNQALQRATMCRRYPPTPNPVQGPRGEMGNITLYPAVQSHHWCGEYKRSTKIVLQ